jgi:hypothetical protein
MNSKLGSTALKLFTSKGTILGLSAVAGLATVVAYESGKISQETQERAQQTVAILPENSCTEESALTDTLPLDAHDNHGVELTYSGTQINYEDNLLLLEKGREYNIVLQNDRLLKISESNQPVAITCDRICAAARKVILSCFEETSGGCGWTEFRWAAETLLPYPHEDKK